MSTDFPTGIDSFTNPTATDPVTSPDHAAQHANVNDAVEALEAKVGADSSAVNTSHDYKLGEVTSTDKAVGKTATQTLTNKTIDGDLNTLSDIGTASLKTKTGADASVATGTAGTSGNVAMWNADGDLVDASIAATDVVTGASTDTLTNKTFDANGTGNSISNIEVADMAAAAVVTEGEGLASSDNDTSFPTTAAVKDYVDANVGGGDLVVTKIAGEGGNANGTTISTGTEGVPAVSFPNGSDTSWDIMCRVPSGATSVSAIRLFYKQETTGNIRLRFYAALIDSETSGAVSEDQTDTETTYASGGSDNATNFITVPAAAYNAVATVAVNDLFGIRIDRFGASASDTYEGTFRVYAVEFTFA